jgi:hypothetical protein
MERRGFPTRWINWVTTLLSTSTSRVLLNGVPLQPIQHGRGLRHGDPRPLLFILAIDPLTRLLQTATDRGLLSKLNGRAARFRTSMYADDAVIFLKPTIKMYLILSFCSSVSARLQAYKRTSRRQPCRPSAAGALISMACWPVYRWPALTSPSNILGCRCRLED